MPYFPQPPKPIYIIANNQAEGNRTLADATNWGVQRPVIEQIAVSTSALDWSLWLCETSSFDLNAVTTKQLVDGGTGNAIIDVNSTYNSDSTNVYIRYIDNLTTNTASFYITGLSF